MPRPFPDVVFNGQLASFHPFKVPVCGNGEVKGSLVEALLDFFQRIFVTDVPDSRIVEGDRLDHGAEDSLDGIYAHWRCFGGL